jgi:hypothetical protein
MNECTCTFCLLLMKYVHMHILEKKVRSHLYFMPLLNDHLLMEEAFYHQPLVDKSFLFSRSEIRYAHNCKITFVKV